MLDYEEVKRFKRDLMVSDPNFITGRGRLESVEFHTHEFVYLRGVEDGGLAAAKLDEAIALLKTRGPGYANVLAIVEQLRDKVVMK